MARTILYPYFPAKNGRIEFFLGEPQPDGRGESLLRATPGVGLVWLIMCGFKWLRVVSSNVPMSPLIMNRLIGSLTHLFLPLVVDGSSLLVYVD